MTIERKFWKLTRWARAGRFWFFLALAGLAWLGLGGEARAQDYSLCNDYEAWSNNALCPSREAALSAARMIAEFKNQAPDTHPTVCSGPVNWSNGRRYYTCTFREAVSRSVARHYVNECPPGEVWNDGTQKCSVTCANRPNLTNKYVRGSFGACHDGCQYLQDGPLTVCLGSGADMYCGGDSWKASGQECQVDDGTPNEFNPDQETCRSTGNGWSECVKPNGDHCVTGAKGTRMCWQPGETGQRNDTANIEWADRVPAGDTPTPPSNIENPTQETTTADKGGVSGDAVGGSFVIGGGSGTGNSGGQNNTGSGGTGSGDGEGDNEHGAPGSGLGNVYESDGKTVADIFGVFRARAENAPVIDAATGFLEVSAGSGCPVFTLPATEFWDSMTFDYHCSGPLADNLALGAYLLMAIAAFIAFRVAFH